MVEIQHAELEGQRARFVVPGQVVPLDQPEPRQGDEIGVRLRRRDLHGGRQVGQRQRAARVGQRAQEAPADLDALYAALLFVRATRA